MLYFIRAINNFYECEETRVTDDEHKEHAIEMLKHDKPNTKISVNKADFCFDGYLVNGDFLGYS